MVPLAHLVKSEETAAMSVVQSTAKWTTGLLGANALLDVVVVNRHGRGANSRCLSLRVNNVLLSLRRKLATHKLVTRTAC